MNVDTGAASVKDLAPQPLNPQNVKGARTIVRTPDDIALELLTLFSVRKQGLSIEFAGELASKPVDYSGVSVVAGVLELGGRRGSEGSACLDTRKHLVSPQRKAKRNPFSREWRAFAAEARARLARLELELGRQGLPGRAGSTKRAAALGTCGRFSVAVSPTTGAVLQAVSDGKPGTRKRTCKHRLCPDCAGIRAHDVAAVLVPAVKSLLKRPDISDGMTRMLTLTQHDEEGGSLKSQAERLWRCWKDLRKQYMVEFKTCFASLEITYNYERDSWHPHLHIVAVAPCFIERDDVLASWQELQGYEVGGPLGGVHIKAMDNSKEAIKYPLKGLSDTMERMPERRALELMGWLRGKRLLRTYGELRGLKLDEEEEETTQECDELLADPTTGELWAPSEAAIAAERRRQQLQRGVDDGRPQWAESWLDHVRTCEWSFVPSSVEKARCQLERHWYKNPS